MEFREYSSILLWSSLISFPGVVNAGNTLLERLQRSNFGGWDQGNLPLPANILGLVPWLPRGLYEKVEVNIPSVTTSAVISIVILLRIFSIEDRNLTSLYIALFCIYIILFIPIYFSGNQVLNNYRIWKLGAYLGILLPYVMLAKTKVHFPMHLRGTQLLLSKSLQVIPVFIIFSSLHWTSDWINTSKITLNSKDQGLVRLYSVGHDLQIINLSAAMFTMYGDIKFGAAIRNFGIETEKTFSDSSTLLVIPSGSECKESTCSLLPPAMLSGKSIKIVARGEQIDLIKLVSKPN